MVISNTFNDVDGDGLGTIAEGTLRERFGGDGIDRVWDDVRSMFGLDRLKYNYTPRVKL